MRYKQGRMSLLLLGELPRRQLELVVSLQPRGNPHDGVRRLIKGSGGSAHFSALTSIANPAATGPKNEPDPGANEWKVR